MSASERREQLLDVAKAIVGARGLHAVTIEAVAREAGISRPIVYGHFRDLTGLLEALVDRESARASEQLMALLPGAPGDATLAETMLATFRGVLEAAVGDPVTWRLVLMPPEGAPEVLRERIADGRNAVITTFSPLLGPGGAGTGSPDPELTAHALSGMAEEAISLALADSVRFSVDRIVVHADWMLQTFFTGAERAPVRDTSSRSRAG